MPVRTLYNPCDKKYAKKKCCRIHRMIHMRKYYMYYIKTLYNYLLISCKLYCDIDQT